MQKNHFILLLIFIIFSQYSYTSESEEFNLIKLPGSRLQVKWGDPVIGVGAKIRYAFIFEEKDFPDGYNCPKLYSIQKIIEKNKIELSRFKKIVETSFSYWSEVANIDVSYTENLDEADVYIGASLGKTTNRAQAAIRIDESRQNNDFVSLTKGAVCLNAEFDWEDGIGGLENAWDLENVITHEVGHVIGLNHYTRSLSRMDFSYDDQESFSGLQPGDISGAIFLYGPRLSP